MAEGSERDKADKPAPAVTRNAAGDLARAEGGPANRYQRVGSTVRGKYRIDAFLATGTMANVYAATHRNGARVALKVLHRHLAEDRALCERFKREGYFSNSIGHPGIVRAIDDDVTEDGCPFLVMELLEGETLEERRLRKGGRLPCAWVLMVADTLLDILAAAHARDVVHRDLKPDNVFITKDGDVKVLDFGVARWNDGQSSSDMTAVGMVLGTPAYMPPEQALGRREDVDSQSDLWAVGATLFVVLSGESVHVGGDAKAKLIATARSSARPLREAAPDIPRSVGAVIDRALAFHKSERWPDAAAMREALRWARMSLAESSSEHPSSTRSPMERVPTPLDTRRNLDDEPTLTNVLARDDGEPIGPRSSHDFLTSAPPITLRDMPPAAALEETLIPTTVRLLKPEDGYPTPNAESLRSARGLGPPSGTSDISDRVTPLTGKPSPASASIPEAAQGHAAPVEIDLGVRFTRPMIAMPAPRPAAGEPPQASDMAPAPRSEPTLVRPRPSAPPGPMLSQIVKPTGGRFWRVVVPIVMGCAVLVAVFVALKIRAANARARAASAITGESASPAAASASPAAATSPENPAQATVAASEAHPVPTTASALPAESATPSTAAAPVASVEPKKRKPRPRPRPTAAGVTRPAEPAGEPAAAAEPASPSEPAPADTTPKDSLPAKEPDPPKPAPDNNSN